MNSKEIKLLQAQLEVVEAEAILLAREVHKEMVGERELSLEEIDKEGVILSYYAWGETCSIYIPWIAFDEGLEAWKAQIEEDKRIIEEKFALMEKEDQEKQKELRYQQYLRLKGEFEKNS